VVFVKATRVIGSWDAIEEYTACGLFPLSPSFNLGEIAAGEAGCPFASVSCHQIPGGDL
jgi:hypothetical protein